MPAQPLDQQIDQAQSRAARVRCRIRVDDATDCWVWTGRLNPGGYGRITIDGRSYYPHRIMAADALGRELPADRRWHVDHLCRNRACCNPDHLELVTCQENLARGIHHERAKTHCPAGHPYDEANTYRLPSGGRRCRRCHADRQASYVRAKEGAHRGRP